MKSITDPGEWRDALASFTRRDFYHTCDYHLLEAERQDAAPYLFYFEEPGCRIALPLLVREIDDSRPACHDATSVYGYAGPLLDGHCDDPGPFQAALAETLKDLGIVCVFSRLHPLLDNQSLLEGAGDIVQLGQTVSIDLGQDPEDQWSRYRGNLRREIKALRDSNVRCVHLDEDDDIEEFARLYDDTMTRREASAAHRFSRRYITDLCRSPDIEMHLFKCVYNDETVCAGLFSRCGDIVQYHLSGTHADYYRLAATKLLLDEVRLWAHAHGAGIFHLGGGVGGAADSLFSFKKGFSKRVHDFHTWRWVIDQDRYDELGRIADRQVAPHPGAIRDANYFPYYRAPWRSAPES